MLLQDAEGSLAHQLGHVQLPDTYPEAFDTTAAQHAVQSIMRSTVATAEPTQQAAALSNIVPDGPLPTSNALQELAHAHDAAAVPALTQDTLQQTRQDSDVEAADSEQELAADPDRPGITFQSLSNQLQSKRELPRKLWKYWLQRYSLFHRFDEGILMDEEGWYSATPEVIAAQQATKCRCSLRSTCFTCSNAQCGL